MGPLNFFKQFVSTSFEKLHGEKKSSNPRDAQHRKISKLNAKIRELKAELSSRTTHAWETVSHKLPQGLSEKLSRIVVEAGLLHEPEDLKKASPQLLPTLDSLNRMSEEEIQALCQK